MVTTFAGVSGVIVTVVVLESAVAPVTPTATRTAVASAIVVAATRWLRRWRVGNMRHSSLGLPARR